MVIILPNIKKKNENENEKGTDLELLYVLMQPTRQKIIKILRSSKEPLYIKEIADRVAEEPRNVSFHLATLAEHDLVDGEYREIEPPTHHSAVTGRAGKFYKLTPKVDEVIKRLATELW